MSVFPSAQNANLNPLCDRVRQSFPGAFVVTVVPAPLSARSISTADSGKADYTVNSLVDATQIGIERVHARAKPRRHVRPDPAFLGSLGGNEASQAHY